MNDNEKSIRKVIKKFVKRGMCCIDIGANIGEYAQLMLNRIDDEGKLFVFEPSEISNRILFPRFCTEKNVTGFPYAVSDVLGKISFYLDTRPEMGGVASSIYKSNNDNVEKVEVTVTTIDEMAHSYSMQPNFIKIDTEGADPKVIWGGRDTIKQFKPMIIFEMPANCYDRGYKETINFLKKDYILIRIQDGIEVSEWYNENEPKDVVDIFCYPCNNQFLRLIYTKWLQKWFQS